MSVSAACAASFAAHRNDCSGFVKAVAAALNVPLDGMANESSRRCVPAATGRF